VVVIGFAGCSDDQLETVAKTDGTDVAGRQCRHFKPGASATFPHAAERFREGLRQANVVGSIAFPGEVRPVSVQEGIDQASIDTGPGWYPCSGLPGEGRMVYVAGHRTTHGAPFLSLGALRTGDRVRFAVPYAIATYTVTKRTHVEEHEIGILHASRDVEQLRLQTSTIPAGHTRLIVFARLSSITRR
jgi:LPXTG-site transpeptidase (sortase) family protein